MLCYYSVASYWQLVESARRRGLQMTLQASSVARLGGLQMTLQASSVARLVLAGRQRSGKLNLLRERQHLLASQGGQR